MTISTAPAPLSYAGNGATTAFPITWKYFAKSHVVATLRDSLGNETVWVEATNYTLTPAGVGSGGTLTATVAPAVGQTLVIELVVPNTQARSLPIGGPFPSDTVEDGLDLAAQRDAKLEAFFNRSLRVPKTDTKSGNQLQIPNETARANKVLGFDGSGIPTALAQVPGTVTDISGNTVLSTGSSTARTLADRFSDTVNVFDYINATQVAFIKARNLASQDRTTVTAGINAALATGKKNILFPNGIYGVNGELAVATAGQSVFGENNAFEVSNANSSTLIDFNHLGSCFKVTQIACSFSRLSFVATDNSAQIAIDAARTSNTDDMDVSATYCSFKNVGNAIKSVGRGCYIWRNVFESITGTACISLSWPTSGVDITGSFQDVPEGFRANRIQDNRAHSITRMIETTGANKAHFRGAIITGNQLDIGGQIFTGGIHSSIIADNVCEFSSITPIYIDAGGQEMSITGNILHGKSLDIANSPASAIYFDTGSTPNDTVIANNSISYVDNHAIRVTPATSRLSIIGNTINGVAQSGSGSCIKLEAAVTNAVISGNCFLVVTGTTIIDATGASLTRCNIVNNTAGTSAVLIVGSPTDGGNNNIMHRGQLVINRGSLPSAFRPLTVSDSGARIADFERTAAGGVTIGYINPSGEIKIAYNPTGTDVGAMYPSVDNGIDAGRTSERWRNVYTQLATLVDGVTAPATIAGHAVLYVDAADGDLKVKFGDGFVRVIAADT